MAKHTTMDKPAHTPGQAKGEGHGLPISQRPTRKAGDATGINVADRKPISAKMPNLPPA